MNDFKMIEQIKMGNHNTVLKILYKEFPKIKVNITKRGGTHENAQEIFHDSLLLLIEKVNDPTFKLTSSIKTFWFYGV